MIYFYNLLMTAEVNSLRLLLPPMSAVLAFEESIWLVGTSTDATYFPDTYSVSLDGLVDSVRDAVGIFIEVEMSKHHDGREKHGGRVGGILILQIKADVTATRFEHGVFATDVAARNQAGTTDQTSTLLTDVNICIY